MRGSSGSIVKACFHEDSECSTSNMNGNGRSSSGFPSPADDYLEPPIDLSSALVKNPVSTFYARIEGNNLHDHGLDSGDILVIDRSLRPKNNGLALCVHEGEFVVKKCLNHQGKTHFIDLDKNDKDPTSPETMLLWGMIAYIIKPV